ncbi:MAG: S-layer homology domain-containing protein, partial [Oscillospiraceae bacterium]|nr:S-layer homology domain-containing protein [Oscillospiraceae bacterium]
IPKEPIFPDLTSGPAFNAVQWAATMRIIEGRDGLFHPKEQISRAQFAVILHRYAGRPNVSSTVSFTDVTPGTTIGRAVAWAVDKGITSGRSSTVFGINDIISRELMMVMLYNYHTKVDNGSGGASANALARFTDRGDVLAGALNAMRWAVENGLLTGQGGKILPKASMTRDQLVTILYRYDKVFN